MSKKILLQKLREIGVIFESPVTLRSGTAASFYCDIKKSYGYPNILEALANEIGKLLPQRTTCIAASGYGGLPLAAIVAVRFDKKFTAVRDTQKSHGKKGFIEGYIPQKNDVVIIIDDVLTTGSSIKKTMSILKGAGVKTNSVVVVVKRNEIKLSVKYLWVFTIEEILESTA